MGSVGPAPVEELVFISVGAPQAPRRKIAAIAVIWSRIDSRARIVVLPFVNHRRNWFGTSRATRDAAGFRAFRVHSEPGCQGSYQRIELPALVPGSISAGASGN